MPPDGTVPSIWVLLGERRGDNNQLLALAQALGLPFETKQLEYNRLHRLPLRLLGASTISLTDPAKRRIAGPAPDLLLAIGRRSVPIVRAIRERAHGRTKAVHIGNPRISPRHFDLVLTTPQYPVEAGPNVLEFPIGIGRPAATPEDATESEAEPPFFAGLPAPRRLLLLGGPTLFWTLDVKDVVEAVTRLLAQTQAEGGSLILLGSPRTPDSVMTAARDAIEARAPNVPAAIAPLAGPPSYLQLLDAASSLFVTADSVSMVSEALRTGKPIGLVPVRQARLGKVWLGLMDSISPGRRAFPRDLRAFWRTLEERGLAGTVEAPRRGDVPDALALAVTRVRQLLRLSAQPARDGRDSDRSAPANPA